MVLHGRERAVRMAVRNYMLPMTAQEMQIELDMSIARKDPVRTRFVAEYIDECRNEEGNDYA